MQRKGIVILCVIFSVLVVWQSLPPEEKLVEISTSTDSLVLPSTKKLKHFKPQKVLHKQNVKQEAMPFRFDPNTLSDTGFLRLGLNRGQIACIMRYRKKVKFRTAADFSKLYVINKQEFDKLSPYIEIIETSDYKEKKLRNSSKPPKQLIEINSADSLQLISLPLIGAKRAQTILRFRNRLGGFYCVAQLHEVYGLPDSVLQIIMPQIWIDSTHICKINLNKAEYKDLQKHPYIGAQRAKQLLEYRRIKGNISALTDLEIDNIFTPDELSKMLPYLKVD